MFMIEPIRFAFIRVGRGFKHAYDSWYEGWRVVRGVISLLVPFSLLGIILIAVDDLGSRFDLGRGSALGDQVNWLVEILPLLFITAFMAVVIVYFLRLLHWLQTHGRAFWNEETAPHLQGEHSSRGRPRVNKPLSESKYKFVEWSALSLLIWLTFGLSVLLATLVSSFIGWNLPELGPILRDGALQFLEQVPVIGQIIAFDFYPGDGPLGTASYFLGAIPASIAVRNLVFVFEHVDEFDTTEDESLARIVGLSCAVILGVVAVFAFVGIFLWLLELVVDL